MSVRDKLYHYNYRVDEVIDGDTLRGELDFGMRHGWDRVEVRLAGIQCKETRLGRNTTPLDKEAGLAAKAYVKERITNAKEVIVKSVKIDPDNFGRIVGIIYVDDVNLNDELVEIGHAIVYDKYAI